MSGKKSTLAVGVLAGLLVGGSGMAIANVAGDDTTITACVNARGSVRIPVQSASDPETVGSATPSPLPSGSCLAGEQPLTWNRQGPAGPQGPALGGRTRYLNITSGPELKNFRDTNVLWIPMDAGSYVIDAQLTFAANVTQTRKAYFAECTVLAAQPHADPGGSFSTGYTDEDWTSLALRYAFTFSDPGFLIMNCKGGSFVDDSFKVRNTSNSVVIQEVSSVTQETYATPPPVPTALPSSWPTPGAGN
ncbi:hypothetical protein ACFQVD_42635 [Streptosporangium amethystogenes subsp. fukuiense]|uniref:Secreted protein n=1 Tax=Streptosporangium amethystogenes subsp. fukuiense TaxID=698418 RepID=A0ABW2TDU8_9ACTN